MTKKHFIQLANSLKRHNSVYQAMGVNMPGSFTSEQISMLADFCKECNPRFNRERWLTYINGLCGPNGGTVK